MRPNLLATLQEGGRSSTISRRSRWLSDAMVVSEVAVALVLVIGAGLLLRSFLQITFNQIPMDEMQAAFSTGKSFAPEGRLKLPALQEVQEKTLFEGFYDFLLGVRSRRAFRVIELSNPARLAIDFRH